MNLLRRRRKVTKAEKQQERESFEARLQMEAQAQEYYDARLKVMEIAAKNMGRIK